MMTSTKMIRVLVVDDHPIVSRGLTEIINREPDMEVCSQAQSLDEAVEQFQAHSPDLVLTDLSLKESSGVDLIAELVALQPDVKVLAVSMHDETLYAETVLRAGAKGYLCKDESLDLVVVALRRIYSGRVHLSEQMANRMLSRNIGASADSNGSPIDSLSARERQVFEQIGRGVRTRVIAENLNISRKTVETYRENIKTKLNLADSSELMRHAVKWVMELREPEDNQQSAAE